MHACAVAAGQSCSFARSRLRHPMRCWQHLSDGATAWSRTNDATSACRCRAHFCGLLLCTAAKAVANARMRRGCRAELPLACSCVTRAVLAASERWCNLLLEPRKRCDVRAYMPRALGGLPLRANVHAERMANARTTHAPHRGCRPELQLCSLAAALLMQSFGCGTAKAAQTARWFACTC